MIEEVAPAKINLYLHVGSIRADGLHDLKSLFVFAEDGDLLRAAPADELSLTISGPFAEALADEPVTSNLVWRAAETLKDTYDISTGARLDLDKRLPVAAGIGGGSADAAAALRALIRLWALDIPEQELDEIAFRLGADVPACLHGRPINVSGAGEDLSAGPSLPPLWVCLVNPRVALNTGPVFRAFDDANPNPAVPKAVAGSDFSTISAFDKLIDGTRNDLEPYATALCPEVADALNFLASAKENLAARMSGSGATCFGLFVTEQSAKQCAEDAGEKGWWAMAAKIGPSNIAVT